MPSIEILNKNGDVWIDVAAELDRTTLTVRQILELDQDALIRLSRSAGESIDLLIGGARIAQGEIVVADDAVGVRITEFREED
jgi:flagellar motor switch protein FliN/FliY